MACPLQVEERDERAAERERQLDDWEACLKQQEQQHATQQIEIDSLLRLHQQQVAQGV